MRLVIQRTTQARVLLDDKNIAEIGLGMLILAGVARTDSQVDVDYMAGRVPELRIFKDQGGKMNLDLRQVAGSVLVVPNFTLYGDCTKGRRPGFDQAARPEAAKPLFESLLGKLRDAGLPTKAGIFGADMKVELVNDGPVTFVIDSPAKLRAGPVSL